MRKNVIKIKDLQKNKLFTKDNYYCFYDSEFNAYDYNVSHKYPQEVISIGICITDKENNIIEKYYSLIKLKAAKYITKRCSELTGITNKEMKMAIDFEESCKNVFNIINKYKINTIYTYGNEDKNAFIKTANLYKNIRRFNNISNMFRDIRIDFKDVTNGKVGEQGLLFLKKICNISGDVMHNALDDAVDLAKVAYVLLKKGYNKKIYKELSIEREETSNYKRSRNITDKNIIKAPQDVLKARNKVVNYLQEHSIPNLNNGIKRAIIDDLLLLFKK